MRDNKENNETKGKKRKNIIKDLFKRNVGKLLSVMFVATAVCVGINGIKNTEPTTTMAASNAQVIRVITNFVFNSDDAVKSIKDEAENILGTKKAKERLAGTSNNEKDSCETIQIKNEESNMSRQRSSKFNENTADSYANDVSGFIDNINNTLDEENSQINVENNSEYQMMQDLFDNVHNSPIGDQDTSTFEKTANSVYKMVKSWEENGLM